MPRQSPQRRARCAAAPSSCGACGVNRYESRQGRGRWTLGNIQKSDHTSASTGYVPGLFRSCTLQTARRGRIKTVGVQQLMSAASGCAAHRAARGHINNPPAVPEMPVQQVNRPCLQHALARKCRELAKSANCWTQGCLVCSITRHTSRRASGFKRSAADTAVTGWYLLGHRRAAAAVARADECPCIQ